MYRTTQVCTAICLLFGVGLIAKIAPSVLADDPLAMDEQIEANEAAIDKGLSQFVSFNFKDVTLQHAAAQLGTQSGIDIQIDKNALETIGLDPETQVTIQVQNISLRAALKLMLLRIDPFLDYAIQNKKLLITARDWPIYNLPRRFTK